MLEGLKTIVQIFAALAIAAAPLYGAGEKPDIDAILKLFEKKDYDGVVAKVDEAGSAGDEAAFLLNLKGAALTKKKDYPAARQAFQQALQLSPGLFAAAFNIGETDFLQRNYANALDWFRSMLVSDPRNELLQFKIFLCQLQLGDKEAAGKTLSKMRYPGDSPAWYYAQAAWEISAGDKGKAKKYITAARSIFPGKTELFDETFIDLGFPK